MIWIIILASIVIIECVYMKENWLFKVINDCLDDCVCWFCWQTFNSSPQVTDNRATMMTILSLMIIITMMTLVTMTQRKRRGNMCNAKENSVEILIWLLICSRHLRGFVSCSFLSRNVTCNMLSQKYLNTIYRFIAKVAQAIYGILECFHKEALFTSRHDFSE